MLPRVVQWSPATTEDQVIFVVRNGRSAEAVAGACAEAGARVAAALSRTYLHGVNISGGWVTVDDDGPGVLTVDAAPHSVDSLVALAQRLAPECDDFGFVAREPNAADSDESCVVVAAWDGKVEVEPVDSWIVALVDRDVGDGVIRMLQREASAVASKSTDVALRLLERAKRIDAERLDTLELAGRIALAAKRYDVAKSTLLEAVNVHGFEPHKASAYHLLGNAHSAVGEHREAAAAHRVGLDRCFSIEGRAALASALVETGALDDVCELLIAQRSSDVGARHAIETAEKFAALGEVETARGLLRWGLMAGGAELLQPVPANRWPKPPELTWAAAAPYASVVRDVVSWLEARKKLGSASDG